MNQLNHTLRTIRRAARARAGLLALAPVCANGGR